MFYLASEGPCQRLRGRPIVGRRPLPRHLQLLGRRPFRGGGAKGWAGVALCGGTRKC